jgi:hypothetical protein
MSETTTRKPRAKRKVALEQTDAKPHPFRDVMRAGVPLVQYETSDPAATIRNICGAMNGDFTGSDTKPARPVIEWDCLRSVRALNDAGKPLCSLIAGQDLQSVANPVALLARLDEVASETGMRFAIIFMHNAHRFSDDVAFVQGVWNLRDRFKRVGACLVMLCPIGKVPLELKHDLVTLSDPLPESAELSAIVKKITTEAQKSGATFEPAELAEDGLIIDTLRGLSPFGAEQVTAMSVRRDRLDSDVLWERKKRMIEQTPGLAVWQGGETFDELGGLSNLKTFLTSVLTSGKNPIRGILYADEIEKSLAGSQGDTSGTSQDQLGVILRCMQDWDLPGIILCGHPGTGKSAISKAAGNIAGAPVIALDLGAMKGSLVGESEGRIRAAMEVFRSVSQGKGIVIATCNKLHSLPPELRRRFSLGIFMVDLPGENERANIWQLWLKRYNLPEQKLPDTSGWTGAEIKACCDVASRTAMSLLESAKYIVPVSKSAPEQVSALRQIASGKFISADKPGIYEYNPQSQQNQDEGRRIQV